MGKRYEFSVLKKVPLSQYGHDTSKEEKVLKSGTGEGKRVATCQYDKATGDHILKKIIRKDAKIDLIKTE